MQTEAAAVHDDAAAREQALDPLRSFIVQAPAGSGKTELLTQRFLRLLPLVDEPEEIIAVTFTRKAAAEMRDRILRALRNGMAESAPEKPHEKLTWELAKAALARDTERNWQLLSHPTRLRVETIDALNGMLTRQMPLLSGYGQQPAIEERPAELYREAALRCLRHLGEQDGQAESQWSRAVGRLLLHLDNRYERLAELLMGLLASRDLWLGHLARQELDREHLEAGLRRETEHQLQRMRAVLPDEIRSSLPGLFPRIVEYGKRDGIKGGFLDALADLGDLPGSTAEDLPAWQAIVELLLTKGDAPRKTVNKNQGFPADDKPHKAVMQELLMLLAEAPEAIAALARVRLLPPPHFADSQWQMLATLAEVLPLAVAELQLVFAERGTVDFAEMAQRARQALGDAEAPTELALYLDHRISHLLVDEFQDTSQAQVDLLERLTAGWMPGDNRSLFLVGDPMQSIYRFREAEVGLFLKAREEGLGNLSLEPLLLSRNFRSSAGIVEWVNASFREVFPAREDIAAGAVRYSPSQAFHPHEGGESVVVHPAYERNDAAEAEQVVALAKDFESSRPAEETLAILVRARTHLAAIIPALRKAGISFQAVELESLGHLPVVADILALTRALTSPADRSAWLAVLRSPVCGLSLADLLELAGQHDSLLAEQVNDPDIRKQLSPDGQQRVARIAGIFEQAESWRGRRAVHERVEAAWLALGYPATLHSAEDTENARLAFQLLCDLEDSGELPDVNDFGAELEALFAAPDPAAGRRIQIMTLHKAKGLEFDTVVMPGLGKPGRGDDTRLLRWMERPRAGRAGDLLLGPVQAAGAERDPVYGFISELQKEQDELEQARLLYVGATRARSQLHLFGHVTTRESKGEAIMQAPAKRSPLATLWPVLEGEFERKFVPPETPVEEGPEGKEYPLYRLPENWQGVTWPDSPIIDTTAAETEDVDSSRLVFEWAGETARHVGSVVHRYLERMANGEDLQGEIDPAPWLREQGVLREEMHDAVERVRVAVRKALHSEKAAQLLDPAARDSRNEWPLSGMVDGKLVHATIDRSFVDSDGVRWIIDYKTSSHEGGELEAFLQREKERYAPQLETYARLVRQLEDRPVRLALYFPLLDEMLTWQFPD